MRTLPLALVVALLASTFALSPATAVAQSVENYSDICLIEDIFGVLRPCTFTEEIARCVSYTIDSEAQCLAGSDSFVKRTWCRTLGLVDDLACYPVWDLLKDRFL